MEETALQRALRENAAKHHVFMEKALRQCRSFEQREQCRNAYIWLILSDRDVISQRHGMKPMLWWLPPDGRKAVPLG